uniref:Uncharacterized protein n=1 Tax=Arundo donax TaxID=35708 RepID=A0A0A8YCE8_ARUDO
MVGERLKLFPIRCHSFCFRLRRIPRKTGIDR